METVEFNGENLRKFRQLKQLTQKQLASLAGLSEIFVRKMEKDKGLPSLTVLRKLGEILEVRFL